MLLIIAQQKRRVNDQLSYPQWRLEKWSYTVFQNFDMFWYEVLFHFWQIIEVKESLSSNGIPN